eukprot:scaffold51355_cov19-Tisochrysis_lutea.AAC.1
MQVVVVVVVAAAAAVVVAVAAAAAAAAIVVIVFVFIVVDGFIAICEQTLLHLYGVQRGGSAQTTGGLISYYYGNVT